MTFDEVGRVPDPPWDVVEKTPGSDLAMLAEWEEHLVGASSVRERVRALVGRALASYWSVQLGVVDEPWESVAARRFAAVDEALDLARSSGGPSILAEALLGQVYARWGPDHLIGGRSEVVSELEALRDEVSDASLRLRIREWSVLRCLDAGDVSSAWSEVLAFEADGHRAGSGPWTRRSELWRSNLAMIEGRIDDAVDINREAVSSTAHSVGSPFSFQNVMIATTIERYLRGGLAELVDAAASIRASSPRVEANWTAGLALILLEAGRGEEAQHLICELAKGDFAAVPRDLNWLVTMAVIGIAAAGLPDPEPARLAFGHLTPFGDVDAIHGSGYASYGPVARVIGVLAARLGLRDEAKRAFDQAIESRSPTTWTTLARLNRARLETGDPRATLRELHDVELELLGMGMSSWAAEARSDVDDLVARGAAGPAAVLTADGWSLSHPSGSVTVPDGVGTRILTRLLVRAGETVDATSLEDGGGDRAFPGSPASVTSTLDARARREFRSRVQVLERLDRELSIEEHDELVMIRRALAEDRWHVSSDPEIERARVRVTKSLGRAISAVAEQSPGLGEHLRASVHTGRRCSYDPLDGSSWYVGETRHDSNHRRP